MLYPFHILQKDFFATYIGNSTFYVILFWQIIYSDARNFHFFSHFYTEFDVVT